MAVEFLNKNGDEKASERKPERNNNNNNKSNKEGTDKDEKVIHRQLV